MVAVLALAAFGAHSEEVIGGPAVALAEATGDELVLLQQRLARSLAEAIGAAARAGAWTPEQVDGLVGRLLVDPGRFERDPEFRERVLPVAAGALPADAPSELRDRLLTRLSVAPGVGLFDLERIEIGWGTALRRSSERKLEPAAGSAPWSVGLADVGAPIEASIYSLPGTLFEAVEAVDFLSAVRARDREREILVLVDSPLGRELEAAAGELGVRLIRTWGRSYSPWPRDPMSVLWGTREGTVLALRPNRQPTREADSAMGLELIQELPAELDERLGRPRWAIAPIPFHNGNMLPTANTLWISLHTLEPRILEILGVDRVPVASFTTSSGVTAYLRAARRAARELESVFGRPVEYVHALPDTTADAATLQVAMRRLGGGAGYDLDSAVTLLPPADGRSETVALVGQPSLGAELVIRAPVTDLAAVRAAYRLAPAGAELARALADAQDVPRSRGLELFLDLVADHLSESGMAVRRVPLLYVPTSLLARPREVPDPHFLIGWNNVVLQPSGPEPSAEGFASLHATGDREMKELFAELGYRLELLPPLVESVLRNGGYRCASNHIRR